jgi:hypothetical protein
MPFCAARARYAEMVGWCKRLLDARASFEDSNLA